MSTTPLVPPQPSSTFSPAPTSTSSSDGGNTNNGGISPAGSQLYLFTFLTTLLLLLGVSCAIIVRSLILRRRFRRRVQEAIANGVYMPGLMDRMHRDIGEKPKMWDVWIGEPITSLAAKQALSGELDSKNEEEWTGIMPVAATKLPQPTSPTRPTPSPSRINVTLPPSRSLVSRFWFRAPPLSSITLSSLESQTRIQPDSTSSEKNPSNSDSVPAAAQVSLLIAMPHPSRPMYTATSPTSSLRRGSRMSSSSSEDDPKGKAPDHSHSLAGHSVWNDLEEGELPHLELAVMDIGYLPDRDKNKDKDSSS